MRRPAQTITIREHESIAVDLTPEEAYEIQTQAAGKLDVYPASARGRWTITAGHHVGILTTRRVHVAITPKLPVRSILTMLEDESHPFGQESHGNSAGTELSPAVAAIYAQMLERALTQGAARRYTQRTGTLQQIQGRIDMTRTARSGGIPLPLHCVFDEHTIDSSLNRTLKEAAARAAKIPGTAGRTRARLARSADLLAEAGPYTAADAGEPVLHRTEAGYRSAYMLARTLIGGSGPEIGGSGLTAATFLLDMNLLFQTYITSRIRAGLPPGHTLIRERPVPFDTGEAVQMRPDILVLQESRPVAVADVKYKNVSNGVTASDLYQMSAYMTALGLRSGTLIYAGEGQDGTVTVAGTGAQIRTVAVDLATSAETVERQTRRIARGLHDEERSAFA